MNVFLLPIFVTTFFMIGTAYGIPLSPEDTEVNSKYKFFTVQGTAPEAEMDVCINILLD